MSAVTRELRRALRAGRAVARAAAHAGGATPHRVVWRRGPARLRRFDPPRPAAGATPLLFVMPLINRWRIVDLLPETSLIGHLVGRGITVYLLDWGEPVPADRHDDMADHVALFIPSALAAAGLERVDLAGYCLGGTLATMFAARYPERVRRLVTINAPIDFEKAGLLRLWTDARWFPVERITAAFGNMPGAMIGSGFTWQLPVASALKAVRTWPRFDDAAFCDRFVAMELWNADAVDVAGAAYRQLIRDLYRGNRLFRGELEVAGRRVALGDIRCPVLVAAADGDHICPPEAARALLEAVCSERRDYLHVPGGHIGSTVGPKARAGLHDPMAGWLLS